MYLSVLRYLLVFVAGVLSCYFWFSRAQENAVSESDTRRVQMNAARENRSDEGERGADDWSQRSTGAGAQTGLTDLFATVDGREFRGLLREVNNGQDFEYTRAVSRVLLTEWAHRDPEDALEYVTGLEAGAARSDMLAIALKAYASANGADALTWAEQHLEDQVTAPYLLGAIYAGLAAHGNPRDVIDQAQQLPAGPSRNQAVEAVIGEWARQDMNAVFDWIEVQPLSEDLFGVYRSVMFDYINQHPDVAPHVIRQMRDSDLKGQLAESYTRLVAGRADIESALQWAESIESEQTRHNATWIALDTWSQNEPQGALDYALEYYQAPEYSGLLRQMSENLARTNPPELANKLDAYPVASQVDCGQLVAQYWFQQDPAAAERWLESLSDGAVRQGAVAVAVDQYINNAPQKAYEIAESMTDEQTYWPQITKVVGQWYRVDPEAALAAVSGSYRLDAKQKAALVEQLAPGEVVDILLP